MKPEDPGPHQGQEGQGRAARRSTLPIIDDGIANLQKALDIDKEYDDAMAYMNLLIRETRRSGRQPGRLQEADRSRRRWVQKALDTKKAKAARQPTNGGITAEPAK